MPLSSDLSDVKLEENHINTWTISDIIKVLLCLFIISAVLLTATFFLLKNEKLVITISRYVTSLLILFLPIIWIKKKYGLPKKELGLKGGKFRLSILVTLGISTALIYVLLIRMTPLWHSSRLNDLKISENLFYIIIFPISINGFAHIILTPISEEVLDRGFIFGYLRRKFGVISGLFLQSLLFSVLHLDFIYGDVFYLIFSRFLVGLILGILYEATGSLYPSMICHGLLNYLIIIFSMSW